MFKLCLLLYSTFESSNFFWDYSAEVNPYIFKTTIASGALQDHQSPLSESLFWSNSRVIRVRGSNLHKYVFFLLPFTYHKHLFNMCSSATASFVSASVLTIAGAISLSSAKKKNHKLFAAIPLIFGIQQLFECLL